MQVCVTGGAGFIGSHLVERLVRDGARVVVLDDLSEGRESNLDAVRRRIDLRVGDVREADHVASAVHGAGVVYHLAALASVERSVQQPELVASVNLGGTMNVLHAARQGGTRRLVFASSSSVYGDTPCLPKHEDLPPRPLSPYAASKAGAEAFAQAYRGTWGFETAILRFFNVYGPRQLAGSPYAGVVPTFVRACLDGRPLLLHGDGRQTRDFTYVADVVDALVLAADAPQAIEGPINVAAGRRRTLLDLVDALAAATGRRPLLESGPTRTGDIRDSEADNGRARERLGWTPATSLEEGLRLTVKALRARDTTMETSE